MLRCQAAELVEYCIAQKPIKTTSELKILFGRGRRAVSSSLHHISSSSRSKSKSRRSCQWQCGLITQTTDHLRLETLLIYLEYFEVKVLDVIALRGRNKHVRSALSLLVVVDVSDWEGTILGSLVLPVIPSHVIDSESALVLPLLAIAHSVTALSEPQCITKLSLLNTSDHDPATIDKCRKSTTQKSTKAYHALHKLAVCLFDGVGLCTWRSPAPHE